MTTRLGGASSGPYASLNLGYSTEDAQSNVAANREAVQAALGLQCDRVFSGWLMHGREVSEFHADRPEEWPILRKPVRPESARHESMFRSDAAVSDAPGVHLLVTFADCVPVLFADPKRGVVGIAHAGWRGTATGIAAATVRVMCDSFGCRAEDVVAAIGPSIGACCYRVGSDVIETFLKNGMACVYAEGNGSIYLDLWESNVRQLAEVGVEAVEVSGLCTSCHTETFFSHRAEGGLTGRFGACIGLAPR